MHDALNTGLINQVLIRQWNTLSLTPHEKLTCLLRLARFIDRPHQEKPGSPKQCLHSCQPATHNQTLTYIPGTTGGVLTQTQHSKNLTLVTLSWHKLPLFTLYQQGRHLGRDNQWSLSGYHLHGMACMHRVCGGRGTRCLIRAPGRSITHASYNKQQHFDQIKKWASHESSSYASMHATQQGMPSKHSCQSLKPDLRNK